MVVLGFLLIFVAISFAWGCYEAVTWDSDTNKRKMQYTGPAQAFLTAFGGSFVIQATVAVPCITLLLGLKLIGLF